MSERPRPDSGQSTVEFALVLPAVAVVALALVQVGVSVRNQLAVELAAREGARAASMAADTDRAATTAATASTRLPVEVATSTDGATVSVTVTYSDDVAIPLLGGFLGPFTHTARVSMALEPP